MRFKFKNGTYANKCNDDARRYLRISAGPQCGKYVHDLILEAKIGRKLTQEETCEHKDGNGLNVEPSNLEVALRNENTRLMRKRNNYPT